MRWRFGHLAPAPSHSAPSGSVRSQRRAARSATLPPARAPLALPEAAPTSPRQVAVSAGPGWSWQMPAQPPVQARPLAPAAPPRTPSGRYGATTPRMPSATALIGAPRLVGLAPLAPLTAPLTMPSRQAPAEAARLRIPSELVRQMAAVARVTGRSESALWSEAAREWLRRRVSEDEPPPPPPAAGAHANPRARRAWAEIDSLLAELRSLDARVGGPDPSRPAA